MKIVKNISKHNDKFTNCDIKKRPSASEWKRAELSLADNEIVMIGNEGQRLFDKIV